MINLGPDETLSEYVGSLSNDSINLESITQYLYSVNEYESDKRSQIEPVIPPKLILDSELQLLSPYIQSLQLNPTSIAAASQAFTVF